MIFSQFGSIVPYKILHLHIFKIKKKNRFKFEMTKLECIALFVLCALDKNCQYLSPCYDAVTQVTTKPVIRIVNIYHPVMMQ